MVILVHAVHIEVLTSNTSNVSKWISAIAHFCGSHNDLIQDKVYILSPQVVAIVEEIQHRKIITNKLIPKRKTITVWKFSGEEAWRFAEKLNKCVEDNLM